MNPKLLSIWARSRLKSQETCVLIGCGSLRGSISWQLSGRKWVKLATSNCGRLQAPSRPEHRRGVLHLGDRPGRVLDVVDLGDPRQRRLELGEGVRRRVLDRQGDHVRGADQRLVEGEQERQLQHHRQAAGGRVDAMLAVERLRLLGDLGAVALVLAVHLADEGRHPLHLLLRPDLPHEEGSQQGPDDDREDDDRQREVAEDEPIRGDQQVEEGQEEDVPRRREMLDPQEPGADEGQGVMRSLADRVISARMQGVATTDAQRPHPRPVQQPVALDGVVRVPRAARGIAAAGRHPGEEPLVRDDQSEPDLPHPPIPDRSRSDRNVSRSSA